jgi:hypothetical protein
MASFIFSAYLLRAYCSVDILIYLMLQKLGLCAYPALKAPDMIPLWRETSWIRDCPAYLPTQRCMLNKWPTHLSVEIVA